MKLLKGLIQFPNSVPDRLVCDRCETQPIKAIVPNLIE